MNTINSDKIFYNNIITEYISSSEITFDELCSKLKIVMRIWGELEAEIREIDGKIEIKFFEKDLYSTNERIKMYLNLKNEIKKIEPSIIVISPVNQATVLFLGSLIDKRIVF